MYAVLTQISQTFCASDPYHPVLYRFLFSPSGILGAAGSHQGSFYLQMCKENMFVFLYFNICRKTLETQSLRLCCEFNHSDHSSEPMWQIFLPGVRSTKSPVVLLAPQTAQTLQSQLDVFSFCLTEIVTLTQAIMSSWDPLL